MIDWLSAVYRKTESLHSTTASTNTRQCFCLITKMAHCYSKTLYVFVFIIYLMSCVIRSKSTVHTQTHPGLMGPTVSNISVKFLLWPCSKCTSGQSMSPSWDFKGPCEGSTAVTSSEHPVKQPFQHPAVLLCLTSGYFQAIHCCFSCFQCSAMWKINSSGYSTSTQANLNIAPSSLFLPLFSPAHKIKMMFPIHYLHPTSICTSTSASLNHLYSTLL